MLRFIGIAALAAGLSIPVVLAQTQDRDARDAQDIKDGKITTVQAGTILLVRTQEDIGVNTKTERIYRAMVDQDVRDANDHIAIMRGSPVELKVRVGPGNELTLDLESIDVNSARFGAWSETDQAEAHSPEPLLATIVDPAPGLHVKGSAINVPCDSVLQFRIEHTLIVGIQIHDPGEALYARQNLKGLR
jgi:hypothetical protein